MSEAQQKVVSSNQGLHSRLSLCILISIGAIARSLAESLTSDRYNLHIVDSDHEFPNFVQQHKEQLDCLIVLDNQPTLTLLQQFHEQGILLPAIIIKEEDSELVNPNSHLSHIYHSAEVILPQNQLETINSAIDQALTQFLHLAPACSLPEKNTQTQTQAEQAQDNQTFLLLQQRRLAEKLKERLGYLGVYYKRNPKYFSRNLDEASRSELLEQLRGEYRQIILNYFGKDEEINQEIDQFVNRAFFADLSVSQILEIHMELMDEFAQQLKLEGRSEEILLDYRLSLIDIIAHLCEMYRRSIPREDLPFELLFRIE